jgi:hypothetical protein
MHTLKDLVEKYGSDKNVSLHTSTYTFLFNNIRRDVKSVLEIGVGTVLESDSKSTFRGVLSLHPHYKPGGSLRAFRDFFPNAQLYGIDIGEDCKIDEERLKTFIFDSTDKQRCDEHLETLTFDLIIDDGSHYGKDQIATLSNLFHRVEPGGFYIIEDVGGVAGGEPDFIETYGEQFSKLIGEHEYCMPLSNIIVIKKTYSKKGKIDKIYQLSDFSEQLTPVDKSNEPAPAPETLAKDLTIVTGLWNLNKPGRSFEHYLECFGKILEMKHFMYVYVPAELEDFVWKRRRKENTFVKILELSDIKGNYFAPFWDRAQGIRNDPDWINQTGEHGWLKQAPQTVLEYYNPIVMSKMFMVHDAKVTNPFNTDYFLWLDAGIANTVYEKYFTENNALDKITPHLKTFLFLSYPYETKTEIHGFKKKQIDEISRTDVKYVCRGGLFGGHKDFLSQANATYYALVNDTLSRGLMGTEESIFSIMANVEPHLYRRYELDENGLIVKFIQALLDDKVELASVTNRKHIIPKGLYNSSTDKTSLYMLTFNYPEQVEHTIQTWLKSSKDWIEKPRKILLDNSTKQEAIIKNKIVADTYGFEHIITGKNGGICGGRQLAAEHFHESDSQYYFFFEDDMGLNSADNKEVCRNGFRNFIPNLYTKVHKIMAREEFDFLKLSFTEVYMDNNIQVSWYNVPQVIRSSIWPDYDQLPVSGLDPNAPRTKFDRIDVQDGLSYITGDIYYANWPMIVSKKGNQKMFIDTKWTYKYEQVWMSHMFQETIKKNLNPACLLASPVLHNRIAYYSPEERRENEM